ncbi:cytochrome P450 [Teratosphaeria nubilosa]|uniref:Cytochrome P450 n=1 Tax=Teratosphaeria nubilosa TaxID=161662 RepID=A0A6G1L0D3_9PEZI|nr:cytochrome P450 [Teratosphaeria nubilosa]
MSNDRLSILVIQTLFVVFLGHGTSLFTNLVLKRAVASGRRIFYIDDLHVQYGSVVRISPSEISVSDVEGFKQIYAVTKPWAKDIWYEKLTNFPRHSVFTLRAPKDHAQRRKLFARGFSKTYLREHWEPAVKEQCLLAVDNINREALTGSADVFKWFTFMATDIVGVLGFGESFGTLKLGRKTEYIRVLEAAVKGNGMGAELPWLRAILARIPAKALQEAFNSTNYVLSYGTKVVENAKNKGENSTLMAAVLAEAAKEGSTLDDMTVRTEATSLIFAGSGTTANTLTYMLWSIIRRPKLHEAIEKEVASVNGTFTDAGLEELPLLNACIQETLRLYCAVAGSLPRNAPPSGANIAGYYIPAGVTCSTQAYTLHRDTASWSRPDEFDPYRHIETDRMDQSEQAKNARATFCGWGAGAYTCLGQHLAMMEMRLAAAYFFQECKGAKLGPTAEKDMELENYFVIVPKGKKCEITLA